MRLNKITKIIDEKGNVYENNSIYDILKLGYDEQQFIEYLHKPINEVVDINLKNLSLLEVIDKYIEIKKYTNNNIHKSISQVINKLQELESLCNIKIMPNVINDKFWNTFIPYMLKIHGLKNSTVKHMINSIIAVLNWAINYGCVVDPTYKLYHINNSAPEQIALNEEEFYRLWHFDVKAALNNCVGRQHLETLEKVKDTFILQCNMGLRISDLKLINKSLFSNGVYRSIQKKTGKLVVVDLIKFAINYDITYKILEKYDYKCPYTSSSYNKYIKELFYYAGVDNLVKSEYKIINDIVTEIKPKYEKISSHTARRTFITINSLRGYSIYDIRKATGHTNELAYRKYFKPSLTNFNWK